MAWTRDVVVEEISASSGYVLQEKPIRSVEGLDVRAREQERT